MTDGSYMDEMNLPRLANGDLDMDTFNARCDARDEILDEMDEESKKFNQQMALKYPKEHDDLANHQIRSKFFQ